ncbi:MAG: MFS transporter [Thermoplasmata archaeon]
MARSWAGWLGSPRIARATVALIGLRVFYAYNWLDIGPALPAIGRTFGLTAIDWGYLVAAFLVGAALLQVPAGLLARRWGTRRVSLVGALLLGGSAVAIVVAPNFATLLALRVVSGAGAGLFFSPAIALVASLHPEGSRGLPVGVFSSAFSAGAGLGVFASAVLVPVIGWRDALALGGVVLLALLVVAERQIPREAGGPPTPLARSPHPGARLPAALRSPAVWAIGFAFMGLEGASLSSGQYFVPYAQLVRGWNPVLAGAIGALFVVPSVFGGPVGGRLAEERTNRRTQMLLLTAGPGALLALVPFAGIGGIAAIATTFSFAYGMVYAIMYILPSYLPGLHLDDAPLAIGLFNGLQLGGGAMIAALVGATVGAFGYVVAFELMAGLTVATLVMLAGVPATAARANRP